MDTIVISANTISTLNAPSTNKKLGNKLIVILCRELENYELEIT